MEGRVGIGRTVLGGMTSMANEKGTPYEPCFTPVTKDRVRRTPLLEHHSAPKAVWDDALGQSIGPFYRVYAILKHGGGENAKEGTVSQDALAWTVDRWSRIDDLYCVMVQPLEAS